MADPSALEVRDAFVSTLGTIPGVRVVKNTATGKITPPVVVVAPGTPWVQIDYTMGPTINARSWLWELTVAVVQKNPEASFQQLASTVEAVIDKLLEDPDLGGVVEVVTVDQINTPDDEAVGDKTLLGCRLIVGVVS